MPETSLSQMEAGRAESVLRQFARRRAAVEHCDLCGAALSDAHLHLLELATRQISCSCGPCAVLFSGQEGARFRRIPEAIRQLSGFVMTDLQWDALMIPINLAFFFQNSLTRRVTAMYPGPAGATESSLILESWSEIAEQNPVLRNMESDVEALLVNRIGEQPSYFLVPIDQCYRLVGMIRMNWKGLSGGAEVWTQIQSFFAELISRSQLSEGIHA